MGRPGTSGGGGGSCGGHHSGRTSGGHRMGGSRPGTNSHRSSHSVSGGSFHRNGGTYIHMGGGHRSSPIGLVVVLVILVVGFLSNVGQGMASIPKSTRNREPIESVAYTNDCIVDELGWIEEPQKLSKDLKQFYEQTGIQPYIVLQDYDPKLTTDAEKQEYAKTYYETQIDNEGTFLYMYFGEPSDTTVGYMAYVNGKAVTSVMDEEAVNIFWAYLDRYWTDADLSMTEVFTQTFTKTANTIMDKSTTGWDIVKYVVLGVILLGTGVVVVVLIKQKHKREKERAEETERILNTPLHETDTEEQLKNKYL